MSCRNDERMDRMAFHMNGSIVSILHSRHMKRERGVGATSAPKTFPAFLRLIVVMVAVMSSTG